MFGLSFDPKVGLMAPDTAEIREKVIKSWLEAFAVEGLPPLNTAPSSPAGQLIDALTAEVEAATFNTLFLANQFNPKVAAGRFQDALGHIYFLKRKIDEPTVVTCQLTGVPGTVVPYGALVQSKQGHIFICNKAVVLGDDSQATTTFRAAKTGPLEVPPYSLNSIVTTIVGWDSVENPSAGAIGRHLETRAEFEFRRKASVAAGSHGSVPALYGAMANLDGVLDLEILENISPEPIILYGVTVPAHGVTICVYGGDDEAIAEIIYRKKDAGCDTGGNTELLYIATDYHNAVYRYRIVRPRPVNFHLKVTLGSGQMGNFSSEIKNAVFNNFYGLLNHDGQSRVGLAKTVYASRFYGAVMGVSGVQQLHSIDIALGDFPTNYGQVIDINADQEPVLSRDNITVHVLP
ncbi:MAG: baseplate J/gp47 family protein [Candidatus Adiutrix sp.]